MFERFTPEARQLVIEAQAQRQALGDALIGTEHLLLALVATAGPAGSALRECGVTSGGLRAGIEELTGSGGSRPDPDDDEQLLRSIGIDMDDVRDAVEDAFGPGALDRARSRRGRAGRWWALGRSADEAGRGRFNERSKRVIELSLREALRLETRHIGPEHLGLGVIAEGQGLACALLARDRVEFGDLRTAWEAVALAPSSR